VTPDDAVDKAALLITAAMQFDGDDLSSVNHHIAQCKTVTPKETFGVVHALSTWAAVLIDMVAEATGTTPQEIHQTMALAISSNRQELS